MKPLRIACVGEAMIELSLAEVPGMARTGIAGDTLNSAIYMQRAQCASLQVSFVSVIGTDPLSDQILAFIAQEGISTRALRRDPKRLPGIYAVNTDASGERSFFYWRDNSAARLLFQDADQMRFNVLEEFDVIYLSAITLAILPAPVRIGLFDWISRFRKKGGRFAFDSNYRPLLWSSRKEARECVDHAWRLCDIALPSLDDELELFGDANEAAVLKRFATYDIPVGILKRGEIGPVPINEPPNPDLTFEPAQQVVDTTGAGDSFAGTFLAHHLTGGTLSEALLAAHYCSSAVVGHPGAIIPKR